MEPSKIELLERYINMYGDAVIDTDRDSAMEAVRGALHSGIPPEDVLFKVVVPTIELMIKSVRESFGASLAQHFMASQIAAEATEELIPRFTKGATSIGRMVIGTSVGDFHGLGKRIVIGCVKSYLIDAIDLGLNVPPERFVDEAIQRDAQVIGISSMMVHTARDEQGPLGVRRALRQRGLEDQIKIIVGGAPYRFDPELYLTVQADGWAEDGIKAGPVVVQLVEGVKQLAGVKP